MKRNRSLLLKPGEEKRILRQEYWVYHDEVASKLSEYQPGEIVDLLTNNGQFVARGFVNPLSKIVLRVLTFDPQCPVDEHLINERIKAADRLRKTIRPTNNYYRMVFAEADSLPGLVVDRFDDLFVVQVTSVGMENFKPVIFSTLLELYPRSTIVEKSLSQSRSKDGLDAVNKMIYGRTAIKVIEVNGVKFEIDFLNSQKTGFFLDQRDNYLLLKEIGRGRKVLDVFSYLGGWGLHAFYFGAQEVDFVEISRQFLQQTERNVQINGFPPERFKLIKADAVKYLKELSASNAFYGLIVLDPPAFVKSRDALQSGVRGYREINLRALKMISADGFLISCSCSHFLSGEQFIEIVESAARDARRRVRLLSYQHHPYDHPILLGMSQSHYLKCALFHVD